MKSINILVIDDERVICEGCHLMLSEKGHSVDFCLNGKEETFPGVFIRAPKISQIGTNVKVLARHKEDIVMVEAGNILAASFHPELTDNFKIHRYFINNFI